MTTANITPPAEAEADIIVAVAETLATIDVLLAQTVTLSREGARLKQELSDLAEERRVREAVLLLGVEGKNESERQARLRLELAADADYRRMLDAERDTRTKLAEVEAKRWAARQKVAVCLALLRMAAGQAEGEEGEAGQAEAVEAEGEAP
jgi:hypothetical protein